MTTITDFRARLVEAEGAQHRLAVGEEVASVSHGDRTVAYHKADRGKLDAYIAWLRQQIGTTDGTLPRRGPIHFSF